MKKIKIIYTASYILFLICILGSWYFENTHILYGDLRFITLIILYSLGLIFGILSPMIFIVSCIAEKSSNRIWISVLTLIPILWLANHSTVYYKDLFSEKAVFQSDVLWTDNFELAGEGKTVTIEYEDTEYVLQLTDFYYDLIENNPPDKSRTVYFKYILLDIYPHKYPVKIEFYKNTGIICDVQILNY